jgi:hypothetical protein
MPYYNVRVQDSVTREFVICAPERDSVEEILAVALAEEKFDPKKIVHIRTDSDSGMSVYDADKTNWTDALKKAKAK